MLPSSFLSRHKLEREMLLYKRLRGGGYARGQRCYAAVPSPFRFDEEGEEVKAQRHDGVTKKQNEMRRKNSEASLLRSSAEIDNGRTFVIGAQAGKNKVANCIPNDSATDDNDTTSTMRALSLPLCFGGNQYKRAHRESIANESHYYDEDSNDGSNERAWLSRDQERKRPALLRMSNVSASLSRSTSGISNSIPLKSNVTGAAFPTRELSNIAAPFEHGSNKSLHTGEMNDRKSQDRVECGFTWNEDKPHMYENVEFAEEILERDHVEDAYVSPTSSDGEQEAESWDHHLALNEVRTCLDSCFLYFDIVS